MIECQICNVKKGKHKVEPQGICGDCAEKIVKLFKMLNKKPDKEPDKKPNKEKE